jgi:putative ABC transport system substrate-binding protein
MATTMPVIGFLNSASKATFEASLVAFHRGLNESGYEEGRNVSIEYRWADGNYGQLPALAQELVDRQVNVIAASGGVTPATAAKGRTSTIPIIFVCGFNPADPRVGLVGNLNKPGGNATGINVYNTELLPERSQLLSEMVPAAGIALLMVPNLFLALKGIEQGEVPGARILNASTESDLEGRFAEAAKENFAVIVAADTLFTSRRDKIVGLAATHKVPTIYPWREYAEAGGLMSYGASLTNPYRQLGVYAGMVLNGSNTADLPVLRSTAIELVINRGTANALGLTIPPPLLARADRIIG